MTIAIVDPFISGNYLSRKLNNAGQNVIALFTNNEVAKNMIAKGRLDPDLYQKCFYMQEYNQSELLDLLRENLVTVILPGTEYIIEIADRISDELGLVFHNPIKTIGRRRNKSAMLEYLHGMNIAVPPTEFINLTPENLDEQLSELGNKFNFPVFVRPCLSGGSFNIRRCDQFDELKSTCNELATKRYALSSENVNRVIVQEFIDAPEYAINVFSQNGKHIITGVWQYTKSYKSGNIPIYERASSVILDPKKQLKLQNFIDTVLNALDYHNGFSHIEVFWDNEQLMLIESNFRLPGAYSVMCQLESKLCGSDQTDLLIDYINQQLLIVDRKPVGQAILLFIINSKPYTVPEFSVESFSHLSSFVLMKQNIEAGTQLEVGQILSDCILYVGLYNQEIAVLQEDLKQFYKILTTEYQLCF